MVGNETSGSGNRSGLYFFISECNKFDISSRFFVTTMLSNQFANCFIGNL